MGQQGNFGSKTVKLGILVILAVGLLCLGVGIKAINAFAETTEAEGGAKSTALEISAEQSKVVSSAMLTAAISMGLGSIAAGIAVAYVGAAALGTIGEKPELAGRALIFVGLAEGVAVWGFIVAVLALGVINKVLGG